MSPKLVVRSNSEEKLLSKAEFDENNKIVEKNVEFCNYNTVHDGIGTQYRKHIAHELSQGG